MLTISEGEKVSDIQNLTSQVQELAQKHGFWNTWSVRLIALTLVATALYFFAQWMANRRGNELNEKQAALIRAKDNELALDLKAKDEKIAATNQETKRIETEAQTEIARLTSEAEKAREGIAAAQTEAARANEKAEAERLARAELEQAIAPRGMEQVGVSEYLKPFAGFGASIESVNDFEAKRMANQIFMALGLAEWNVSRPTTAKDDAVFFDGVSIETNVGALPREDRSMEAANVLAAQLEANAIKARRRPASDDLPINTISIKVGLRPMTYFLPKKIKDTLKGKTGKKPAE